jgi:hypothetical protein
MAGNTAALLFLLGLSAMSPISPDPLGQALKNIAPWLVFAIGMMMAVKPLQDKA